MTDENKTPEEHSSLVGGSTAARRLGCPASWALEQQVPEDAGTSFAREGTALHEMIAVVLDKDKKPEELLPFEFSREAHKAEPAWTFTVDEDLWYELGQPALDAFDDFVDDIEKSTGGEFEFLVEQRCQMVGIPDAFGTSDIIWKCGDLSGVWDWKFGRMPVSAENNKQLQFYARAAMYSNPTMFSKDPEAEVVLSIMQPKVSEEPSEWTTTVGDLERYRHDLIAAVSEAKSQGVEARIGRGDWCNFARCKSVCPEFLNPTMKLAQAMGVIKDEKTNTPEFAEMLPDLLDMARIAETWARELFAMAHQYAEEGNEIPRNKLISKRSSGREFIVTEEEVKKFLKNRRYTLDDYMPRKMLSMPQVEKLLKKDGRILDEKMYAKKPSSGTTLVPDGDPRDAYETNTALVSNLAEKLAHLAQ